MMTKRLAIASIVLATSMPAILAQQGGGVAPAPNPAANPPRLPLEQRISHSDPSRYRASMSVHGGPGRLNAAGFLDIALRQSAGIEVANQNRSSRSSPTASATDAPPLRSGRNAGTPARVGSVTVPFVVSLSGGEE